MCTKGLQIDFEHWHIEKIETLKKSFLSIDSIEIIEK